MESCLAGERLQRTRVAWLEELRGRRRILSAGEGHGRFASACGHRHPAAEITCVEASPKMLARAQARTSAQSAHFRWHRSDVMTWEPNGKFDAIATCFFLDCFPPAGLAAVIAKLASCASDDAVWLVADFAIPARGPARWRARAVHALMYTVFRRVVALSANRLTPPDDLLCTHGFTLFGRREFDWGLLRADLWRRG